MDYDTGYELIQAASLAQSAAQKSALTTAEVFVQDWIKRCADAAHSAAGCDSFDAVVKNPANNLMISCNVAHMLGVLTDNGRCFAPPYIQLRRTTLLDYLQTKLGSAVKDGTVEFDFEVHVFDATEYGDLPGSIVYILSARQW